jgi:hypothetical protein
VRRPVALFVPHELAKLVAMLVTAWISRVIPSSTALCSSARAETDSAVSALRSAVAVSAPIASATSSTAWVTASAVVSIVVTRPPSRVRG